MKKKKLPLGVQDFVLMREENNIYIDTTEHIYQLLTDIEKRGYAEKYLHSEKEIIAVGINFSSEKKCINEWQAK